MAYSTMKAVFGILFLISVADATEANVFEKVVGLLENMSKKVAEEGKEAAAAYDKYACFCKEQADEKLYAIEKSEAKIKKLNADINELTTTIAFLNGDDGISGLNKKISKLDQEIASGNENRQQERNLYLARAKDMDEAIYGAANAVEAIEAGKKSMKGAKLDLMQFKKLQGIVAKQPVAAEGSVRFMQMLAAPRFEVQSNDILAVIQNLHRSFLKMKEDLDNTESEIAFQWNSKRQGLNHEKTFAEQDRDEKEQIVESKNEELEESKLRKDQESNDMAADQAYLDDVTSTCENKAKTFDEESKTRSAEMTSITQAIDALKDGATGKMNKRMLGELQQTSKSKVAVTLLSRARDHAHVSPTAKSSAQLAPTSLKGTSAFIQLRSKRHHLLDRKSIIKQVQSFIHSIADTSKSPKLNALAVRLKVAGDDDFVKVRGIIKDLLAKLQQDAKDEAQQKGFCDESMSKAIGDRDKATSTIETASAKISTLTAAMNSLTQENADLNTAIAKAMKGLNEATETRSEEKAQNKKTMVMSEEALRDVDAALASLKAFYTEGALIQKHISHAPKKHIFDRSGNTIGDLAPEETKYEAKSDSAHGVLGLLEVLRADFQRSYNKAEDDESEQAGEFAKFKKVQEADVSNKKKKIGENESDLTDKKTDLLNAEQSLADGKDLLSGSEKELESLKSSCIGADTHQKSRKERQANINALKDAMKILETWSEEE